MFMLYLKALWHEKRFDKLLYWLGFVKLGIMLGVVTWQMPKVGTKLSNDNWLS